MAPVILIALYACIIPVGKEEGDSEVFCSPGIVTAFISFHNHGEAIGLLFGVDKGMGGKEQWLLWMVTGYGPLGKGSASVHSMRPMGWYPV